MIFEELAWGAYLYRLVTNYDLSYLKLFTEESLLTRLRQNPAAVSSDDFKTSVVNFLNEWGGRHIKKDTKVAGELLSGLCAVQDKFQSLCEDTLTTINFDHQGGLVQDVFNHLRFISWENRGPSRSVTVHLGETFASKLAHVMNPSLFVMWDDRITGQFLVRNMIDRGNQDITWDVENRPVSITDGENTSTFVYDGNGNRVKKTEGGETILYVNKYYEENLTTEEVTTYYYHGGKLVAKYQGSELSYIHQDHLASTSVMTDSSGNELGTIKYFPFGATRSGSVPTDKKFTGQRLDDTGLYYYNARYYDANIGRFISADTIVPDPTNPQSLNRYSYCLNNPLKYNDPTGHYDQGDYAYESLCEAAGYDPSVGYAIYTGAGGEIIGTVIISEFVAWVDDSPEPFDYFSKSATLNSIESQMGPALEYLGIESLLNYHANLTADPVLVILAAKGGPLTEVLANHPLTADGAAAMRTPLGIFTLNLYGRTITHEWAHAYQASKFGAPNPKGELLFGAVYVSEVAGRFAYYAFIEGLSVDASLTMVHDTCSWEVAADLYAIQLESPIPPSWQWLLGE